MKEINQILYDTNKALMEETEKDFIHDFIGLSYRWKIWKGPIDGDGLSGVKDIDSRSLELTEIEFEKFIFHDCCSLMMKEIEEANTYIGKINAYEEKIRRLKERTNFIRFGFNIFHALWTDYQINDQKSLLVRWPQNKPTTFDFPGTILRSHKGTRHVILLMQHPDDTWGWTCHEISSKHYPVFKSIGYSVQ